MKVLSLVGLLSEIFLYHLEKWHRYPLMVFLLLFLRLESCLWGQTKTQGSYVKRKK